MGNNSSRIADKTPMADESVAEEPHIPKLEDVEINWPAESEMEHALEKKRKLEDEEPYNDAHVRQKARMIGLQEASRSSMSEISRV